MFISDNCAFFHLWWKENLVKHHRVSKYYENGFLQKFLLHYMSSLTAKFVGDSHIYTRIYFSFLENLKETWNAFITKLQP